MIQTEFKIETDAGRGLFPVIPGGDPVFKIELPDAPSYNELLYLTPRVRAGVIRAERSKGYKMGLAIGRALKIPIVTRPVKTKGKSLRGSYREELEHPVTQKALFCFVKIWREASLKDPERGKRKRDIYNLAIKALLDGLTDAGVWVDDNEEYHQDFWISYRGVADKTRIIIKFFEQEVTII
jgi:Holliday junction resolvase RusA-like endonuclease